jgi:predicted ArsR family transcriptional regulator
VPQDVSSVAALGEPLRRKLYEFVVAQRAPVSRDQAADALGIARHVVKFHLDRLEGEGLLESEFSRPSGRGGPGAGRPTKFYRRSSREFAVTLPERRYDVAGRIMAEAITASERDGVPIADALSESARRTGHRCAASNKDIEQVLTDLGFEPHADDDAGIRLANCPFHSLAAEYTELVCGINLDLITGLIKDRPGLRAALDPAEGSCCVRILPVAKGHR